MSQQRVVGTLLGLAVLSVACVRAPAPSRATGPVPSLVLRRLDGPPTTLDSYRGRVLLVDVWATWCEPCRRSMPFYRDLRTALGAKGFEVLAISVDESADDIRAYLAHTPMPFPVFHDPSGEAASRLGAAAMPTSFLVDRDGTVRWVHDGFDQGDEPVVRARVMALLAETR